MRRFLLFVLFVLAVSFIYLLGCGQRPAVSLKDYIDFELTGYEGTGEVTASVNLSELEDAIKTAVGNLDAETADFVSSMEVSLSKSKKLKNGEGVAVKVSYDEEIADRYGILFEDSSFTYEVEGLSELNRMDPFEGLEIVYQGLAPCVMVDWYYNGNEILDTSSFSSNLTDQEGNYRFLDIGDTFMVSLKVSDEELAKLGYQVTQKEKIYTLTGRDVDSYIKNVSELQQETLDSIKEDIADLLEEQFDGNLLMCEYIGHEMTSIKDVTEYAKHAGYTDGFPESPNLLNLAYLITFDNGEGQISWYTVISANYVTASEQGGQSYALLDQDYTSGKYSFVSLDGLKESFVSVSDSAMYEVSYSVELQK